MAFGRAAQFIVIRKANETRSPLRAGFWLSEAGRQSWQTVVPDDRITQVLS